jgi:hypothetical protein
LLYICAVFITQYRRELLQGGTQNFSPQPG